MPRRPPAPAAPHAPLPPARASPPRKTAPAALAARGAPSAQPSRRPRFAPEIPPEPPRSRNHPPPPRRLQPRGRRSSVPGRARPRQGVRPVIEPLEPRRLFAIEVSEGFPGFYEVTGDGADDVIAVVVDQSART